jgi:hypothetical protein
MWFRTNSAFEAALINPYPSRFRIDTFSWLRAGHFGDESDPTFNPNADSGGFGGIRRNEIRDSPE